jgi:hypothetical protein
MTNEELAQKINELEKTLSPEDKLKLLKIVNEGVEKMNSDVEGLISLLNKVSDEEDLNKLQEKMGIK